MSKTADQASVAPGAADGYTITVSNSTNAAVSLSSITDTLPAGFSYVAGSSTGLTTADPTVSGQTLTWPEPLSVPAATGATPGTATLHFGVTVSDTPGTYTNSATAEADGLTVVPTGDTAPIAVGGGGPTPTTTVPGGTTTTTSGPATTPPGGNTNSNDNDTDNTNDNTNDNTQDQSNDQTQTGGDNTNANVNTIEIVGSNFDDFHRRSHFSNEPDAGGPPVGKALARTGSDSRRLTWVGLLPLAVGGLLLLASRTVTAGGPAVPETRRRRNLRSLLSPSRRWR